MAPHVDYDEFGFFHENAEEFGLPFDRPPVVRRVSVDVDRGRTLSALVWGEGQPELVLLHGGAQNAHTWDTVALALRRPLLALDLPGHGHSDGPGERPDGHLSLSGNAQDVAEAVAQLAPEAKAVVGMSLGGLTTIALAAQAPDLVRRVVLVDVLPGLQGSRSQHIVDFVNGPTSFTDLDELLEFTVQFNPTRSRSSLRRGILHNAEQQDDGTWVWRWARHRPLGPTDGPGPAPSETSGPTLFDGLWDALSSLTVPVLLVRGMRPDSVLGDEDEEELRRRLPSAAVVHVAEAGHSVQGDAPLELAALLEDFVSGS
jgi:pimeloyl-ACP methyl ester carboxylesterase